VFFFPSYYHPTMGFSPYSALKVSLWLQAVRQKIESDYRQTAEACNKDHSFPHHFSRLTMISFPSLLLFQQTQISLLVLISLLADSSAWIGTILTATGFCFVVIGIGAAHKRSLGYLYSVSICHGFYFIVWARKQ